MFDVPKLIESGGLILIGLMIFAETGLLIGFLFPGDTLLFTAGLFAATGKLHLIPLLITLLVTAIAGYEVGYEIGHRGGKRLFSKKDSVIFKKAYIARAEKFYEKHGGKTIVLARFVPIVRTFAAVVAGMGDMDRKRFFAYNVGGAVPWTIGITMLGYWLGQRVPNIQNYVEPIMILAIILTFGPPLYHYFKDRKAMTKTQPEKTEY